LYLQKMSLFIMQISYKFHM